MLRQPPSEWQVMGQVLSRQTRRGREEVGRREGRTSNKSVNDT